MESNSNNPAPPKKTGSRKKLVDLKAVAALLEDSEGEKGKKEGSGAGSKEESSETLFEPNEELLQTTGRVKSQRDLIHKRVKKMDQSRDRVSKNVYDKVFRDYSMQLKTISKLLAEKKALLEKELKNLYMLREKQEIDINRHKEILEEARFRHYLEEYTEEQYKEVEEYESKEILNLQSELSQIQSYTKMHEELFDPEDLGYKPKKEIPKAPQLEYRAAEPTPAKPARAEVTKAAAPSGAMPEKPAAKEWAERTPFPKVPPEKAEAAAAQVKPSIEAGEGAPVMPPEEAGYFEAEEPSEPSITRTEPSPLPSETPAKEAAPKEVRAKAPSAEKEPESILDVIEEAPLEPEVSTTEPPRAPEVAAPTPQAAVPTAPAAYKIVFLEGEIDTPEMELKENISIGRSPSNDLVLKAAKVSRQHAAINKYKDQYIIIDLKSSNGVFINGRKIDEHTLREGDQISIGGYKMVFQKS